MKRKKIRGVAFSYESSDLVVIFYVRLLQKNNATNPSNPNANPGTRPIKSGSRPAAAANAVASVAVAAGGGVAGT